MDWPGSHADKPGRSAPRALLACISIADQVSHELVLVASSDLDFFGLLAELLESGSLLIESLLPNFMSLQHFAGSSIETRNVEKSLRGLQLEYIAIMVAIKHYNLHWFAQL